MRKFHTFKTFTSRRWVFYNSIIIAFVGLFSFKSSSQDSSLSDYILGVKPKLKTFLALLMVLFSVFSFAQLPAPTYVGSAKYSAKGSGATGIPTINFPIPNGITNKNRVMIITVVGERHNPANLNNFFSNTYPDGDIRNANDWWKIYVNGATGSAGYGYSQNLITVSGVQIPSIHQSYYLRSNTYHIPDGISGTIPITFGLATPKTENDEISFIVSVYENVKKSPNIKGFWDLGISNTVPAPAVPVGRAATEIMYMLNGGSLQEVNLSLPAAWTLDQFEKVINTTTNDSSFGYGEHDGIAQIVGHRNNIVGDPTVIISAASGDNQGALSLHALLPFASPSVSGKVVTPTLNSATGTQGGGLWMNVVDKSSNLVVAVVAVGTTGDFTISTGILLEDNNYDFILSKNASTAGSSAPIADLNSGWLTVAEGLDGTTPDGTANSVFNFTVSDTDVSGLRFAISEVVPEADLSVVKTVSNSTPTAGSQVVFTISVQNNGPTNATGVTVADQIPSGYTLVSATPSTGTWTAPNWTIGNLANGGNATLTVVATVNATGPYANTATISGTEPDPVIVNNTSTATVFPQTASSCASSIELVANGSFTTNNSYWSLGGGWSRWDNYLENVNDNAVNDVLSQNLNSNGLNTGLTNGRSYTLSFTLGARNFHMPSSATSTRQASLAIRIGGVTYATFTNATTVASDIYLALSNGATSSFTPFNASINPSTYNFQNVTITIPHIGGTGSLLEFVDNATGDDWAIDNVSLTTCIEADLSVVKTVNNPSPAIGSQVTFTITANNYGPSNATGVVVNDALPAGYTLVSATPSTGTWTAPNWTIGNLANGGNATLTIVATVNATGPYANTATISGNQPDPNLSNNTSTETPVPASSGPPVCNPEIGFSVLFPGTAPSAASYTEISPGVYEREGVTGPTIGTFNGSNTVKIVASGVTSHSDRPRLTVQPSHMLLSLGLSGVDMTEASRTTQFIFNTPTADYIFFIGDLLRGDNGDYRERVRVTGYDASGNIVMPVFYDLERAQVVSGNLIRGTTIGMNNQGRGSYYFTTPVKSIELKQEGNMNYVNHTISYCFRKEISLKKTGVLNASGSSITYSFIVKNTGTVELTNVSVVDPKIPGGVTLTSTSLLPGEETTGTATYTVTAAEKTAGQVQNTATATGTPPEGAPVTDVSGTDFTNNTPTVVPVPGADLSVVKTASSLAPTIGQQVTFTIVAANAGPSAATGVTVNDQIPAGYTLVSASPSTGTWTSPNWNIGNLASGASATLTVTATVNATGPYANTATITGNQPDPNPGNNTDTETPVPTPAPAPAIALVKTGVLSTNGNTVTYTFTVKNTGNVTLNPVTVTDAKLTPNNVTLAATTLAPGAETTGTATYTVTAAEKTAGQVQNTATATGTPPTGNPVTDVSGTDFTNNTPTVVPVPGADLELTKVVSEEYPSVGGQVTFTVTAKNNGPSNATGVVVTDALPSGYVLLNATPSTGVWSAPNWTIGNLANGASASMTIVATVAGTGNHENVASVTGNQPDPDPSNNTDTAETFPGSGTDLEVTKTPNNFTPNVGDQITFTVTAKNNGPRTGTGVTVTDVLPSGYTFVSAAPSQGVWSSPVWSVGTLANGASASMTVVATVGSKGVYRNTAIIDGVEPDSNPLNDTASVVPSPGSITDLEVIKTVNNAMPNIGEQVTFTIEAKNNGPRNATGVVVNDVLPSGYMYVSHAASIGTWSAPNWSVGNLANGANATLTIVATVNATGVYANKATIEGEQPDDKPENNEDTAVTSPGSGTDLEIEKTVDISNPNVGQSVTFTITAKNNGPRNATGVVVTDQIPSGFVVITATPSVGTWTAPNWSIGNLANGASQTLTVVATVNATGNYVNVASIIGNEPDPDPSNNVDSVSTPSPENVADLEVTKVADNMTPSVGGQVTFTITAKNKGPKNATGVVVNDIIPNGYVVLSATPSVGNWSAPNWSIGNLANGASQTLTVVAVVNATGTYANTATITGNQVDPVPGNNTSTVTPVPPVVTPAPSIALVKTGVLSTDGNTITYSFTVTNTGNVPLTGVTVNDPKLTPSSVTLASTTLAVGASTTGTGTYTVTAGDRTAGEVENTATATGNPPTGNPVTDVSGTTQTNDTPTVVPVDNDSSIALVKTGVLSADGNSIAYTFTVTNTGDVTLTNVKVIDPKMTPSNIPLLATTLAPGASTTGTATYTLTEADKLGGQVSNTAITTGTTPSGCEVVDISGTQQNNDTPTVVVLPCKPDLNPAITVLPNNGIAGQRDMVVLLDIKEILGCATKAGEEIRVSVAKVSDFSFNWSTYATATTIPTASVTGLENGRWTFTETSTAWVWVYNGGVINANEISNIGFMGIWNAEASSGKLDFTVTIRNGSGGESNTLNNVDYETVTYDVAP